VTHALAFLAVAAVVILTPGQDTALTIRNTLAGGRRSGIATAVGVAVGQTTWTIAAAAGVTAVLQASEPLFLALRLLGAAYLVYLGAQTLVGAIGRRAGAQDSDVRSRRPPTRGGFWQGVISNLGNPKMAVFFTSLLPQFGGTSFAALLGLGLAFCTMTFVWLSAYGIAVARADDVLRRPSVRRRLDAVTGTVLVAFGLRLATEARH
jgi:threonine/homoserine/homoserine lactone efflux protein